VGNRKNLKHFVRICEKRMEKGGVGRRGRLLIQSVLKALSVRVKGGCAVRMTGVIRYAECGLGGKGNLNLGKLKFRVLGSLLNGRAGGASFTFMPRLDNRDRQTGGWYVAFKGHRGLVKGWCKDMGAVKPDKRERGNKHR